MENFWHQLTLATPLFLLVLLGFLIMRIFRWPQSVAEAISKFVFSLALPAMLFRLMSRLQALPAADTRLLIAFFGSCLVVFILGRWVAWKFFRMNGVAQSVFGLGGVFSNNMMLGIPIAKSSLGEDAIPLVAMVLIFNSLSLWTLVTLSIEWAQHRALSFRGLQKTVYAIFTNPIIVGILSGTAIGLSGTPIPPFIDTPISMLSQSATPLVLMALGMSFSGYDIRQGWRESLAMSLMKLIIQPLVVWGFAKALGLPRLETQVVVLLGSIAVAANVYLVARQFKTLEGPVASALVLSTLLSALTTPLLLALL